MSRRERSSLPALLALPAFCVLSLLLFSAHTARAQTPPPIKFSDPKFPLCLAISGGTASISGALQQADPPVWQNDVNLCCGSGLKLRTVNSTSSLGWMESDCLGGGWSSVSGASGNMVNVNPGTLPCNPQGPPVKVCYTAVAPGVPAGCPDDDSNIVSATIFPPAQAGTLTASPPILCNDGVATSHVILNGAVGSVTSWEKDPDCGGPLPGLPFNPSPVTSFIVGPLTDKECYKAVIESGPCEPVEQVVTIDVDQKPVAGTITASPTEVCPGDDAVLTLTGHSGLIQWYSGPGTLGPMSGATNNTVQNTNILDQSTFYQVQVSSPLGVCSAVTSAVVEVKVKPLPSKPVISGPTILCAGGSTTLTVASPTGSCTYQWLQDGKSVPPPGGTGPSLVVTEPGNYQVTCINDCGEAISDVHVVEPNLLAVAITGPCCACGEKLKLCAKVRPGVQPYQYSWSTGNQGPCVKVAPTSTTLYTVGVTDAVGCQATAEFTVTVCE